MALPTLTDEQRKDALAKAAIVRTLRANLKSDIADGKVKVTDLLEGEFGSYAENAEAVNKTRVSQLLLAMKGVGSTKAASLMEQCGVAENRRLAGLGKDQRRRLALALEDLVEARDTSVS